MTDTITSAEMDFPVPKYRKGQQVFCASVDYKTEMLPCPDCLGTQKWKVITPAGSEMDAACERCTRYSDIRGVPSLRYNVWKPHVHSRTIGAVEVRSGWSSDPEPVRYMAVETGVGSGTMYSEKDLYPDEEAARVAAQARADAENAKIAVRPEKIDQQHFSHLQIKDAAIQAARDAVYNGWYRLNSLVDEVRECLNEENSDRDELKEDIERQIDFDREYRSKRDPFDNLLKAARHAVEVTDLPALASALAAEPFSVLAPSTINTGA